MHSHSLIAKLLLPALIACLSSLFISCSDCEEGSGNMRDESRAVEAFDKVLLDGSPNVFIADGKELALSVIADDNLIDAVTTQVIDGRLVVDIGDGEYCFTRCEVHIVMPLVKEIKSAGSGNIIMENVQISNDFECRAIGSGSIELDSVETRNSKFYNSGSGKITANYLNADISIIELLGSGSIALGGSSRLSQYFNSGSGSINCGDLVGKLVVAHSSGSGNVTLQATNELSVKLGGSGNIYYRGNPTITNQNITGSGKLIKLE